MRALNLKLNADRVDVHVTDYFDTIVYLNNANWSKERIAEFLDRSPSWIGEILRFAPNMPAPIRTLLEEGKLSWAKAKTICRAVEAAPAGREQQALARELKALTKVPKKRPPKPLSFRGLKKNLAHFVERDPKAIYQLRAGDLLSLIKVLEGKEYEAADVDLVNRIFPALLDSAELSAGERSVRLSAVG